MKQALMSQYKSAKGDKASGKGKYLKDPGVHVNFSIFRVCFVFRLVVFVFVSIYTKHESVHETRGFRVSCSNL